MTPGPPDPVLVRFERRGKGSGVTRVERLRWSQSQKEDLLSFLKRRFACGGALKEGILEIQGDRREPVRAELESRGLRARVAG